MTDDQATMLHYSSGSFMAHRSRVAQTIQTEPIQHFALPGALAPIHRDRLEAHQEDGLELLEIVAYENSHFLAGNERVRARHADWVNRDYDAMVRAHRELEMEKHAREAMAAAEYQARLARIMAEKDAGRERDIFRAVSEGDA